MPEDIEGAITAGVTEVTAMVDGLGSGFMSLVPVGLILIALVMGVFWLLGRAKKFASAAR